MQKMKHFIWDFDGTLFDTYPMITESFQAALRDFGVMVLREELRRMMMESLRWTFRFFREQCGLDERLVDRYNEYMQKESPKTSPPFPCAKETCERIYLTGGRNYLLTHRNESAKLFLSESYMLPFFTECVTVENGFPHKPAPDAVYYLLGKYHMKKEETVMIGDRELDIQCGNNAGIRTCFLANGSGQSGFGADWYFETMDDLYRDLFSNVE